jgi:hypothetical protein
MIAYKIFNDFCTKMVQTQAKYIQFMLIAYMFAYVLLFSDRVLSPLAHRLLYRYIYIIKFKHIYIFSIRKNIDIDIHKQILTEFEGVACV